MNKNITNLHKKIAYLSEKSLLLLIIFALVWQFGFPRVTSLAATDELVADISQKATVLTQQEQMVQIISEVARQEGYANVNLVIAIARAESRFNPNIRGEQDKRDRGLYQINSHFNPEVTDACAFDPWCSTRWTISELKAGHAWKWNASRYKWGKDLARN